MIPGLLINCTCNQSSCLYKLSICTYTSQSVVCLALIAKPLFCWFIVWILNYLPVYLPWVGILPDTPGCCCLNLCSYITSALAQMRGRGEEGNNTVSITVSPIMYASIWSGPKDQTRQLREGGGGAESTPPTWWVLFCSLLPDVFPSWFRSCTQALFLCF